LAKFVNLQSNLYGVRPPVVAAPVNVQFTGPLPGATHGVSWISIRPSRTPILVVVVDVVPGTVVVVGAVVVVVVAMVVVATLVVTGSFVGVLPPHAALVLRAKATPIVHTRVAIVRGRLDSAIAESSIEKIRTLRRRYCTRGSPSRH
jgi:hypothetical protein